MRGVSSIGEYEEVVADFFYAVGQLIEASKYNGLRKFLPRNISVGASILCSKSDPGKVLGVVIYASPKVLDLLPGSGYDTVPAYPMEVLADGIF
jgi:hypothetical protein